MSIAQTIKQFIGADDGTVDVAEFRCTDCGETFESAKTEERAQCMECLSSDVEKTS